MKLGHSEAWRSAEQVCTFSQHWFLLAALLRDGAWLDPEQVGPVQLSTCDYLLEGGLVTPVRSVR